MSYRAGSLVGLAALIGVAFLFGGFGQRVVARRVETWRWLFILTGILGVAAGIMTFAWLDITLHVVSILVAWYLIVSGIVHLVSTLADPTATWSWNPAPARDRRAGPRGVGRPFLGAVAD